MNKRNDLSKTRQRKIGKVAILSAMINGVIAAGNNPVDLMVQRSALLTNGGQAPIPGKFLNQRQLRKRARQTQNFK